MTDINALVIEPLVQFYKDSSHLVKKCTKPDHKGKCILVDQPTWNLTVLIRFFFL